MKALVVRQDRQQVGAAWSLMLLLLLAGCSDPPKNRFQGYVEGEFVYVARPRISVVIGFAREHQQPMRRSQPGRCGEMCWEKRCKS
jgi:hypothetical protein